MLKWKTGFLLGALSLGACAVHEHESLVELQKIDQEIQSLESDLQKESESTNPITLENQQKQQRLQSLRIQREQAVARAERVHKEAQEIAAKDQREAQRKIEAGGEPDKGPRIHYGAD